MPQTRKLEGIVLRRNNVGEADRILTILTPQGKLAVVARGVRKLASRKAGALELFQVVDLVISEAKSLPVVTEASAKQLFPRLREDLQAASQAFWAAELIDRLAQEEAGGALFQPLVEYLERVNQGATGLDLHAFELLVLVELGWRPELTACVHCGHTLKPGKYLWSNELGGVLDADCVAGQPNTRPISRDAIKTLRLLIGQHFQVSRRLAVPVKVQQEVDEILHHYLESIGERRWRTPDMIATIHPQ